jgi:outer membrane protein TolC
LAAALAGCRSGSDAQARLDATGLKYVARERVQERAADERQAASNASAPQLEGFTRPLEVVDGKARLSLEEAVRRTLKNSLAIQVASYTPAMAEADLDAASSIFDPTAFAEVNLLKTDVPNTSFIAIAGAQFMQEDTRTVSVGLRKPFATGGTLTLSDNFEHFNSTSTMVMSPTYSTNFTLELVQPLLRNMGLDANKAQIYIASHKRDASLDEFRRNVMDTLVQVESTYWELVYALRDVEVRKQSVALAEQVYEKEKTRAANQVSKPLEVSRARAAATARKAELIRAANLVRDLSDQLKNLLNDPELGLQKEVEIEPADEPLIVRPDTDQHQAVAAARANRPEIQQLENQLKALEAQKRYYWNQLLPRLDISFMWRRNALAPTPAGAWEDQWTGRFTDYGAGLKFEVPIGNRQAEAGYRRSKLEYDQARRALDKVTEDIILEVNKAVREVQTNLEEIVATREARIAAKETLDGEQASFEVGEVTNDQLLRVQRDYEDAQRSELQAITRLNASAVALERAKGTLLEYNNIHVLPKDYQGGHGRRKASASERWPAPVPETPPPAGAGAANPAPEKQP